MDSLTAAVAAMWWLVRAARHDGLDRDRLMSLGFWAIAGGILGSKLLLVLRTLPDFIGDPSQFWSLSFLESAGDFYGGFLSALAACAIYFRRRPDLPVWRSADLCGPAIALGQAVGRVGCFMAGDDYGRPSDLPWAITFTDPEAARLGGVPLGVPLHPVQLYESVVCLALFLFLLWLARRKQFDGQIILSYALLYAAVRFLLEYYRGDANRGFLFGGLFSTSQLIAVLVFLISAGLFIVRRNCRRRDDRGEAARGGIYKRGDRL